MADQDTAIEIADFDPKRMKRSPVWKHCGFLKKDGIVNKKVTVCKICRKQMPYSGNTSTMHAHLDRHHYDIVHAADSSSTHTTTEAGTCIHFPVKIFANVENK